jgi:glycosyltransferase involved in cell wall biosynthesis
MEGKLEKPLVSILMNCYNGEKYLAEAIDSVCSQTYPNWEIVFIDNHSEDNTEEIVRQYDKKIKYYKTKEHLELGEARAFGLELCNGDFVAFLDTDDCYLPNKLERQIKQMLGNSDYQMSYTGGFFIDENGNITKQFTPEYYSGDIFSQQLKRYEINMQSVMLRNNKTIKFDRNLEFSPDYNLFMKICSKQKVGVIKQPLVRYRKLKNSLTDKKISRWAFEMQYTLDKIFTKNPALKQKNKKYYKLAYAKVAYYYARYFIQIGKKPSAIKVLSKYKALNVTYFALFILACLPNSIWKKIHTLKQ